VSATLSNPAAVQERLEEIDDRLAILSNDLEDAALDWFRVKRKREKEWAQAFIGGEGTAANRKAEADLAVADVGVDEEAAWEGKKAVSRTLDTRAAIGMSILRAQSRVGA
jgi:hypothetical protein